MYNPLVFDLGYNQGNYTHQILNKYPGAKIIGVEGHPMYFGKTKPINVELIQAVVSNVGGVEIPFYICDSNPGINSINPEWINTIRHKHFFDRTKRMDMVPCITIDELITKYGIPDIIKMDIEGAESIALEALSCKCGLITFEWSEEFFHDALKCITKLKKLGYTLFSYTEQSDQFIMDLDYKPWENLKIYENIIPDRKERWGMIYAK